MLEFEKKMILSKAEGDAVLEMYHDYIAMQKQINYYYDTEDFQMNAKGVTCRIRYKEGQYITTVKDHCSDKTFCSVENITRVSGYFSDDYFKELGLSFKGLLTTERFFLYKGEGFELVLDRNYYLDMTDYELEIEFTQGKEHEVDGLVAHIEQYLIAKGFQLRQGEFPRRMMDAKSKSERFFERMIKDAIDS